MFHPIGQTNTNRPPSRNLLASNLIHSLSHPSNLFIHLTITRWLRKISSFTITGTRYIRTRQYFQLDEIRILSTLRIFFFFVIKELSDSPSNALDLETRGRHASNRKKPCRGKVRILVRISAGWNPDTRRPQDNVQLCADGILRINCPCARLRAIVGGWKPCRWGCGPLVWASCGVPRARRE